MFSFTKKTTQEAINNPQVIELGQVSEITLGSVGDTAESIRSSRWGFITGN